MESPFLFVESFKLQHLASQWLVNFLALLAVEKFADCLATGFVQLHL